MKHYFGTNTTTAEYGTWVSYGGTARIVLAIVLLAAAGGVVFAGTWLALPVRPARPGEGTRTFMLVTWGLAITAFLVCLPIYVHQARREHLFHGTPADPITPVTATCVAVIFFIILLASRSYGRRMMLASAAIGAMAAPMIFEFPFDLIVMARTYPPIPPDPALYRVLFFAPLFLVEFATLTLLTLSPMVKLSRAAFFSFALMLAVFAVWGLFGFAYPSAPVPFSLNVLSKILAFVTALSLFLPQRTLASAPKTASSIPPPESGPDRLDHLDANYRQVGRSRSFAQVPRTDRAARGRPKAGRLLHFDAAREAVNRDQVVTVKPVTGLLDPPASVVVLHIRASRCGLPARGG